MESNFSFIPMLVGGGLIAVLYVGIPLAIVFVIIRILRRPNPQTEAQNAASQQLLQSILAAQERTNRLLEELLNRPKPG